MDGWMNEWMNNPCSLIIYRNHVDESSQAKVLNLFHFSELYSNRGLSVNPKTTHQWWGYLVRLAGKCGGHTMRIHVLMAMQRLFPLLVLWDPHVTIRVTVPMGTTAKFLVPAETKFTLESWNKENLKLTEEWETSPLTGLLPGDSLEPEKGHLTGVKTSYWLDPSADAGNEWGNKYSKLFYPGLNLTDTASWWCSLLQTRWYRWCNLSLLGHIAGGTW